MGKKTKNPLVRFTGFTGDWEPHKIGDITKSYSGGTPSVGNKAYYNGNIPFIRSAEINSDSTELFITQNGLESSSAKLVNVGDILYALYGATSGEVGLSKINGAINQAILAIIPFQQFDSRFISQWLRKNKHKIVRTFLQGGQGNLSGLIVKGLSIDFPTENEQKQIGEFLRSLDNLIALQQRKYEKLLHIKESMLEKMFPQKGASVPEIRFTGFRDEWKRSRLGEIAEFSKGTGYSKNDVIDCGTPIILYGRLYTRYQTVIDTVDTFVDVKNDSVYSRGTEVIVPASGETAEDISRASAVVVAGILLGGDLNIVYPASCVVPTFLAILISSGETQRSLSKKAQGKSVVHLHNNDLEEVVIIFPSPSEQCRICRFFANLDKLLTLHQCKLEKLQNIKSACLEKMFV